MKVRGLQTIGIVAALLLGSCSSLPLPDTPEKSLLVIASSISTASHATNAATREVALRIRRISDGKEITLPLSMLKSYTTLALDPGSYAFSLLIATRSWYDTGRMYNSWEDSRGLGYRVFMEPQTVQLYPSLLRFADRPDPNQGYTYSFSISLTTDQRARILAELKKDYHWQGWEGCAMVNFEE